MKKKFIIFILSAIISFASQAQKVQVNETSQTINGLTHKGFASIIEMDSKAVEKAWLKKLKEYGKPETQKNKYQVNIALIPDIFPSAVKLFSSTNSEKQGTVLFLAIEFGDNYVVSPQPEAEQIKKLLHDFTVALYREDMNEQIKEAEKAVTQTVKAHERKTYDGKVLQQKLERNAEEKIRLEKQLVENAKEAQRLKEEIEQNKAQQQTAFEEISKVRKLAETKKAKLAEIK